MAGRRRSGGGERGGCLWKLADLALIAAIAWAIAWFGPWRATVRPAVREMIGRLPALLARRPAPSPSPIPSAAPAHPPASPMPASPTPPPPTPTPAATATPSVAPTATPSPAASPAPDLDTTLSNLRTPRLSRKEAARADALRERLGGVLGMAEQPQQQQRAWHENFACAADADAELRAWEGIADRFEAYCATHPAATEEQRREAFQALYMATLVPPGDVPQFVRLKALTKDDVQAMLGSGGSARAAAAQ